MLDLDMIRQRCRERLILAELENDQKKRKRLLECEQLLREDDCFSNRRKREPLYQMLVTRLGFELDEAYDFYEYLDHATEVWGELIPIRWNGKEFVDGQPVKARINPEMEDYYQFETGRIFKVYDNLNFYYLNADREWVHDGSLQKRFYESGDSYWRIKYRIEPKEKKSAASASAGEAGKERSENNNSQASPLELCQLLRKIAESTQKDR